MIFIILINPKVSLHLGVWYRRDEHHKLLLMKLIYNDLFLQHETGRHPENAKRIKIFDSLPVTKIPSGEADLTRVHSPEYIQSIREACGSNLVFLDNETVVSKHSYQTAVHAVGATILASEQGNFALVRPPGHHAYRDKASGFCLFNNIAVATQRLVDQGKRVLIFDFDGHVGDGTSSIFYNNNQVLYWSSHQFPAFPGSGKPRDIGRYDGEGYTINVLLPPGSGDDIFMNAFHQILPIARQFKPDVVAVSAGFDAHQNDLLLDLRVTVNSFYQIGLALSEHFPNIFASLEGGYNLQALQEGVYNFVAGINQQAAPYQEVATNSGRMIWENYDMNLQSTLHPLSKFWNL